MLFYVPNLNGNLAELPEEEAIHCLRTLRRQVGDTVELIDGKGTWYQGTIVETGKKSCLVTIDRTQEGWNAPPNRLHVAIAPTKNIDRFEWFLEKATEIGIATITPLLCQRSERRQLRPDRLEKILIAAMKQSLKAALPQLNDLTPFPDFVATHHPTTFQKFIAHCQNGTESHLEKALTAGNDAVVLIGPEGDFSEAEIEMARLAGFAPVTLGSARLRTETAGVAACVWFSGKML